MNAGTIAAIITAVVALIGAITGLVAALKGNVTSQAALTSAVTAHVRLNAIGAPKAPSVPTVEVKPEPGPKS
jgi:Flp pilus assembly pilin Flp